MIMMETECVPITLGTFLCWKGNISQMDTWMENTDETEDNKNLFPDAL